MIIRVGYPPFLMSREEAAYYLCISTRTLDGLQAQSKIIPKRNGGKRGIPRVRAKVGQGERPCPPRRVPMLQGATAVMTGRAATTATASSA